jgi:hypothetical protein
VAPWLPESHRQNATVMGIVGDAAAAYADAGYFTIVEGIVIPKWFLEPLRDELRARGHEVAYAVLTAPLELCVERRPLIAPAVVESIWRQFGELGEFGHHGIDVAQLEPEAVVAELTDGLRGRFLLSP